jgi:hypothetical protein
MRECRAQDALERLLRRDARMPRAQDALERPDPQDLLHALA